MSKVKSRLLNALDEIGIFIPDKVDDDLDLREYILDSLQFISAIVQIESEFKIEFPSEYLLYDNLISLNSFCNIIESIVEQSKCT